MSVKCAECQCVPQDCAKVVEAQHCILCTKDVFAVELLFMDFCIGSRCCSCFCPTFTKITQNNTVIYQSDNNGPGSGI
jgi:hypothetical protein